MFNILCNIKDGRLQLLSNFLEKLISGLFYCPGQLCFVYFKINSFNSRNSTSFSPNYSGKNDMLIYPAYGLTTAGNTYAFDYT